MKWEASEASGSITTASPSKAIVWLIIMNTPRSNMGNFHQPGRRQGVQTLCTMRGSKEAIKRRGKMGHEPRRYFV